MEEAGRHSDTAEGRGIGKRGDPEAAVGLAQTPCMAEAGGYPWCTTNKVMRHGDSEDVRGLPQVQHGGIQEHSKTLLMTESGKKKVTPVTPTLPVHSYTYFLNN